VALQRNVSTVIARDTNAGVLFSYQSDLTYALGRYDVPCVQVCSCSIAENGEHLEEEYVQSMPGNDTLNMPGTEVTV
jgi:hypothetical protein